MPNETIEVALLEDDAECRHSLAAAIGAHPDMRLAWQAASLHEAYRLIDRPVDVLLVDLGLPDGSGLEAISLVRRTQPDCAVMVSTVFGDDSNLLAAIRAGALGYLLKDLPTDALIDEIRSLHAGGSPISPMMARKLLQNQQIGFQDEKRGEQRPAMSVATAPEQQDFRLSERESEVLHLVARGYTLEEVAAKMGVTRHTTRSFIRRIYVKLQVGNRAEAVRVAMERGLLNGL